MKKMTQEPPLPPVDLGVTKMETIWNIQIDKENAEDHQNF